MAQPIFITKHDFCLLAVSYATSKQTSICHTRGITSYIASWASHHALRWCHNERDGVSKHQPHYCLFNHLFRRTSKKTSKLRVTGLCVGNSLVTGEFPAQMASNAENVFIWWRHHGLPQICQLWCWIVKYLSADLPIFTTLAWYMDHSGYGLGQWEKALLFNAFSHWLRPYPF